MYAELTLLGRTWRMSYTKVEAIEADTEDDEPTEPPSHIGTPMRVYPEPLGFYRAGTGLATDMKGRA